MSPSDAEDRRLLRRLAQEDSAATVRAAAVKRLDDLPLLRRMSEAEPAAEVREAASLRYRQLLAGGVGDDGGLEQRLDELARVRDTGVLAHVVRNGREEAFRAAALERVDDTGVIEQVALHDGVFRLRQAAVQRLSDPDALERVSERARPIDRRIARLARQRADEFHAEDAERERLLEEARTLCEETRGLVDRTELSGTERAEAERLRNRWQALPRLPEQAPRDRFWVLMNRLESRLAEQETRDSAAAEERRAELGRVLEVLDAGAEPDEATLQRLRDAVEGVPVSADRTYTRACDWLRAGEAYLARHEELSDDRPPDQRRAAANAIEWPATLPEPPTLASARRAEGPARDDDREDRAGTAGEDRDAALAALDRDLAALDRSLDAGDSKPARRALNAARSAARSVPGRLPADRERHLSQAAARVAELEDWRRFAVRPKQQDLCERMETLVDDAELTLPERAARIRELHEQWRATGGSDSPEARALWARFSDAARRAFEPCRAHFDHEAERRRENLAARETVAQQLEQFLEHGDPAATETAELERIRRTARADWKACSPVDREAVAPVSERFEALMDRLTALIDERRGVAESAKQALVEEAQALLEWEDTEAAAERAKALQESWRQAGTTRRAAERRLWKAFRGACDGIFERREAARSQARADARATVEEVEGLCARLEALAEDPDREDEGMPAETVRGRFRALSLPDDRVGRALWHRFQRAEQALHRRESDSAGERCYRDLAAVLDRLALQPAPDGGGGLPAGAPAELTEAMGRVPAAAAEPAERRRQLCVCLEIAAGLESPAADESLRLEQQVERLADGMAGGSTGDDDQRWLWLAEWLALGGAAAAEERPRVEAAMAALLRAPTPADEDASVR